MADYLKFFFNDKYSWQSLRSLLGNKKKFLKIFAELIIKEENHFLVVFKPPGYLSQGDRTGDPTIVDFAKAYLKIIHDKPGRVFLNPVHRIDRPCAGVLVLAKTSKGATRLSKAFRQRDIEKKYWVIVPKGLSFHSGCFQENFQKTKVGKSFKNIIKKDSIERMNSGEGQRKKQNHSLQYKILSQNISFDLCEIEITEGAFHQVRSLMAFNNFPVVGDTKYKGAPFKKEKSHHVALVAVSIRFPHPTTGEVVHCELGSFSPKKLLKLFTSMV